MYRCSSACFLSPLILLLWLSSAEASHFRFGNIAWSPTPGSSSNYTVTFTFRLAFRRSISNSYYCDETTKRQRALIGSGGLWSATCSLNPQCSTINLADTGFYCTDYSVSEDWSLGENNFTYTFPSNNSVWTVSYTSCCWMSSLSRYPISQWLVSGEIDLTPRSDNGKINTSPLTRSPAIFRVQEGCPKEIRIPVEDVDGDTVKCRWAGVAESSIGNDSFPHGTLYETRCVLKYEGGKGTAGTYAVTLTLEDFPEGTTNFDNVRPFSAVGLQFLVIITGQPGLCNDIPVFTDSTPKDGECSEIQIGSAYTAVIEAQHADIKKHIVEISTSSPPGMQITSLRYHQGIYYRNVTWYPSQYQFGQNLFCFQAVDNSGLQSSLHCITILVGLSNTPQVILGSQRPMYPKSEFGPGLLWWRVQFDRVEYFERRAQKLSKSIKQIKKPRLSAFIRLVLLPSGYTVYKVDTLSQYAVIDSNRTVLHFAMPKAALSINGSYAILIDRGAVVGQGCSYDGPPSPGITSTSEWGFPVDGVCPVGYSLASPGFTKCVDVDECASHSRSKRSSWWWNDPSPSPTTAYGGATLPASASSSSSWSPSGNFSTSSVISPTSVYASASASVVTPTPDSCSYSLTGVRGNFTSLDYPQRYAHNLDCSWTITVSAGHYIYLHFEQFHLEDGGSHCPYDYVQIFDGGLASNPITTKRCAYQDSWCVYSHSNVVTVVFITDGSISRPGFSAYYERVHQSYPNCSLVSTSQTVSSSSISPYSSVNGIHPTPASEMPSSLYAASSVNVLPNPFQFELHLPSDCDQICSNTYGSYKCSCVSGYQLAPDGKSCLDIDECSINNGGCSHRCFNIPGSFYCGCPEGKSVGANSLTCVEPGVSVSCGDRNMTVSLEKRSFPFFEVSQLHLRYSSCRATQNDTHLLISTTPNGCGTLVKETEDALIFWNEIQADAVIIDYVFTRTHDIKLPFYCSYSRRKLQSLSFTPQPIYFLTEAGYGNLTFRIDLFTNSSFDTPYALQDYPLEVKLDQYIYVRYSVESSADLAIMAVTCKATKDGSFYSWPQYTIIQNGCPRDTTIDYSINPLRSYQEFTVKTFRFFTDYETVYLHCELLACHRYSPNSRCSRGCSINKRKKRDVNRAEIEHEESTSKVILTQGPLVFNKERQSGETEQNKQTGALIGGVAAAGGFGLIAFAALAVLFVKYRIARRFMNEQLSRRNANI